MLAPSTGQAGALDDCFNQVQRPGQASSEFAPNEAAEDEAIPLGDLSPVADFHPETDRWTDRHNRIRLSVNLGVWLFGGELDIENTHVLGLRLGWEVPGFIGIRLHSNFALQAQLEVKAINGAGGVSSRHADGIVSNHGLSLGIFNPELSVGGLAFWAGFGGSLWIYDFNESGILSDGDLQVNADWSDSNISGHIFIELDYKVADIFHIGVVYVQHAVLADHTDEGRFYSLNGVDQSVDTGRNDGIFDDIALVGELTLTLSIYF
ncbi:MAG: hypothetical protein KDD82_06950 [Planctomycetes bacterium]|nr:hypothetical protein [Planctomycetota bacterium]